VQSVDNFVDIYPSRAKILAKSRLSTRCLEKKQIHIAIKINDLAHIAQPGTVFDCFSPAIMQVNNFCEQVQKNRQKRGKSC
jgi:hypothetical protein